MSVQGRAVRKLDSSTRHLDDFLLSQAKSDDFNSKWIVGASFDARPVTQPTPDLADLPISSLPDLFGFPGMDGLPGKDGWPSMDEFLSTDEFFDAVDELSQLDLSRTKPKPMLIGHFTVESYHAIAICLALIDLAKLKHLAPAGYHIQTVNHPLPRQPETVVMDKAIRVISILT